MYRILHPMNALGVPTKLISINEDIDDKDMDAITAFQFYGAVPFSLTKVLRYMKENKKLVVYDVDDALPLTDRTNPWYFDVMKDLGSWREALAFADKVTVSTPEMADYIRPQTDAPITVIPNCYVDSEWTFPRPKREGLRIGFAGSASHLSDLLSILPTIKKLQDKYNFTFVIFGFSMSDYKQWYRDFSHVCSPEAQEELKMFDKELSGIKFEWVPYVDHELYPATLTNIALDIGICAIKDTQFNRCRSAVKAMEYTLSGALALASDMPPYNQEQCSVLVDDWEKVLEHFITHPEEIEPTRSSHLKWIQENRNIKSIVPKLREVYEV